ncbi:hypothetical protein STENM223S_05517 [Streptomyces tendae]
MSKKLKQLQFLTRFYFGGGGRTPSTEGRRHALSATREGADQHHRGGTGRSHLRTRPAAARHRGDGVRPRPGRRLPQPGGLAGPARGGRSARSPGSGPTGGVLHARQVREPGGAPHRHRGASPRPPSAGRGRDGPPGDRPGPAPEPPAALARSRGGAVGAHPEVGGRTRRRAADPDVHRREHRGDGPRGRSGRAPSPVSAPRCPAPSRATRESASSRPGSTPWRPRTRSFPHWSGAAAPTWPTGSAACSRSATAAATCASTSCGGCRSTGWRRAGCVRRTPTASAHGSLPSTRAGRRGYCG